MIVRDPIYGNVEIEETVLVDLMKTGSIQRLKGLSQYGIPIRYFSVDRDFTRYEHSVGVMVLLRFLDAPLEEQAAGLIHDVSHTAFSHVIDNVVGREDETYHDDIFRSYVTSTEIPRILEEHGLNPENVMDVDSHPLLEREAPDLCADRVDYALRDFHYHVAPGAVGKCLRGLRVVDEKMVFDSYENASLFARNYLRCQLEIWGSPEVAALYRLLSDAIRGGIEAGDFSEDELFTNDDYLISKLETSQSKEVLEIMRRLEEGIDVEIDEEAPEERLQKKFRYVDPEYMEDGELKRLSEEDDAYRELVEEKRELYEGGIPVSIK